MILLSQYLHNIILHRIGYNWHCANFPAVPFCVDDILSPVITITKEERDQQLNDVLSPTISRAQKVAIAKKNIYDEYLTTPIDER